MRLPSCMQPTNLLTLLTREMTSPLSPLRDSKLVHLFREAMGSLTCQTTIVAHVSTDAALYTETLTTVQLASRIHRMRRRRAKVSGEVIAEARRGRGRRGGVFLKKKARMHVVPVA